MNLQRLREAVHQSGELDPPVVESTHELAQLLLGGHDQPVLAAPLDAEMLDDRLEIEHLLDVTGDELADLVDHEDERVARLAPIH